MVETMNSSQTHTGGVGSQLDDLDVLISRIGTKDSQQAFQILRLMDAIDIQIKQLEERGANIRAEAGQYESACGALRRQAEAFVRDAGGAEALRAEREKRATLEGAWWWRLDEFVAEKRKSSLLRTVKWGSAIVIVAGLLVAVYLIFFAPSPATMARYQAIDKTTLLANSKNYAEALVAIQQGLEAAPDDPDLLIWKGIIYSLQGNVQQAADIFDKVKGLVPGLEDFYLRRAQNYLSIGEDEQAEKDAQAAIQVNPKSGRGYYILGSAQEEAGDTQSALKNYQTAVDLADQVNDSSLLVEARVKMGYLLQSVGAGSVGAPTPTSGAGTP